MQWKANLLLSASFSCLLGNSLIVTFAYISKDKLYWQHLCSWTSKSSFVIFSIGLCPNPFTSLSWNKEVNKKIQGSILSFPPDVGIIFTCKIATQRVISLLKSGTSLWVPRILLHKNKQIKWGRFSLRKNAMFLIIWKEKR